MNSGVNVDSGGGLRHIRNYNMNPIPITESALIVRTDFYDENVWERLMAEARRPDEPFIFNMEFLEEMEYLGATTEQVMAAVPAGYPHTFIVIADGMALSQSGYPLLLVNLEEPRGQQFRALASQIAAVENNLSTGNLGFEEFAGAVDETGVFSGFLEM